MPKSNLDFWKTKIEKNKLRDRQVTDYYQNQNWTILRIWEHDIINSEEETITQIISAFQKAKANT